MNFRQFLFDEYKYVEKHKSLYDMFSKQNFPTDRRSQNTVAAKMKKIQAFFNELIEKGEISISPFIHLGRNKKLTILRETYDPPVFLLQEEFLKVKDAVVPESLQETKDAFVLQCAFGCRISEFKRLSMDNLAVSDDGVMCRAEYHPLWGRAIDRATMLSMFGLSLWFGKTASSPLSGSIVFVAALIVAFPYIVSAAERIFKKLCGK